MKIVEIGGNDEYMEFNTRADGSGWIEIHNPWAGDTDSGLGASAQITITKEQAKELGNALVCWGGPCLTPMSATQVMEQRQKDRDASVSMFILLTCLMGRAKSSNDRSRDRDYLDCFGLLHNVELASPEIAAAAKAWMGSDPNGLNQYEPEN